MHRRGLLLSTLAAALLIAGCGSGDLAVAPTPTSAERDLVVVDPSEGEVPPLHPSVDGYPEATAALEAPDGERSVAVAVKVAHTSDQRQHGLMEVEDLPDGVGMVFLYASDQGGGFWMKNTKVPLDIAWADADGRIVTILQMEPCTTDDCPIYRPDERYLSALEVPKGWFGEVGVTEDWRLVLPEGLPAPE